MMVLLALLADQEEVEPPLLRQVVLLKRQAIIHCKPGEMQEALVLQ